jgi:amino acid permease
MIGLRLLAGVILAFVLGLMAFSCAKRKANQSATGILYVAVVFVLIGESVSMALTLAYQRPV